MKKNGYTLVELLILIVGLGFVMLIILPKLSTAFNNNYDELYQNSLNVYLHNATVYGNNIIKDEVKNSDNYIISINDLVKNGYATLIDGDIKDVNGNSMLNIKIKLIYDEVSDSVYAEIYD